MSATLDCESRSSFVQLCSTPQNISLVCPGQSVTFTCMTVGSTILAWSSSHYISDTGAQLFFASDESLNSSKPSPNGASIANLTMVNTSNLSMIILESQLQFYVSEEYNASQIICSNNANGVNVTISFTVGKK